ncbi:hypothetical protein M378DRAFT_176220 [Amanita muscaria Koide BX008]|uniref:Uncharacterized protein n=1 Tax=Amanita muscaria (strain Koide BX008) TaxID=946122 RepID=A0A0C2TQ18_AMAMK|nr:hypothetical protein M378DRAFT_176220 [Amanita muscaria Koide BX008]
MGFLKRLFSLKSIRGKKKQKEEQKQKQEPAQKQEQCRQLTLNSNEQLQIIDDQEHEAAANRLLRSSSARFAVVSELDYTSLPPLPHPINNVIRTPAASTISLSSSTTSHRGNYTVQVHKRKRHASTEFPFANRHLDGARTPQRTRGATAPPKEHVHYLGLRSDPSVASLLDLYDDHGRLPEKAFSNSPPSPASQKKQGRAQTRRSGSTLRQLLGAPSSREKSDSNADLTEGDISWAERFLAESDSVSSQASLPLPTPTTTQTHFVDNPSRRPHVPNDDTPDYEFSTSTVDNPALSSMEVELSMGSSSSVNLEPFLEGSSLYINSGSKLPQRASQVFTFLTKKRLSDSEADKSLSRVPAVSRSSSGSSSMLTRSTYDDNTSQISRESSIHPATPRSSHSDIQISQPFGLSRRNSSTLKTSLVSSRIPSAIPDRPRSKIPHAGSDRFSLYDGIPENEAVDRSVCQDTTHINEVKVLMTGPTKVIVTAPTPLQARDTPSRIPRGPRGPSKKRSSGSIKNRPLLNKRSNSQLSSHSSRDFCTGIHRTPKQDRRSSGGSESEISSIILKSKSKGDSISSKSSIGSSREKENRSALSVKADLPSTPIRSQSTVSDSRSLFRAIVTPSGYRPQSMEQSSPASSSELSPVGRQLMMDVRQQRMKAREIERERNRRRSERHGNAYVV